MVPRASTSFVLFLFPLIHSLMKVHINGNAKYFAPHLFFNLVDVVFLLVFDFAKAGLHFISPFTVG